MNQSLYEQNFYTGTHQRSQALRHRHIERLDGEPLAEELLDLGNRHYDQPSLNLYS